MTEIALLALGGLSTIISVISATIALKLGAYKSLKIKRDEQAYESQTDELIKLTEIKTVSQIDELIEELAAKSIELAEIVEIKAYKSQTESIELVEIKAYKSQTDELIELKIKVHDQEGKEVGIKFDEVLTKIKDSKLAKNRVVKVLSKE